MSRTLTTASPVDPKLSRRPAGKGRSVWRLLTAKTPVSAPLSTRVAVMFAMLAGAALIGVTGVIHLHLWMSGYRNIPTIGPLFLLQAIVAELLAIGLVVT